jgi:hypothetical protein
VAGRLGATRVYLRLIWLQRIATSQGERVRKRVGQEPHTGANPARGALFPEGGRALGTRSPGLLQIGHGFCISLLPGHIQGTKPMLVP